MKFTAQQIVQILKTPLGRDYFIDDEIVLAERKKISERYEELKETPRFFTAEEIGGRKFDHIKPGEGGMLVPGYEECSIEARAWWLKENVLEPTDESVNEDVLCGACCYDPPVKCDPHCVCPCHA